MMINTLVSMLLAANTTLSPVGANSDEKIRNENIIRIEQTTNINNDLDKWSQLNDYKFSTPETSNQDSTRKGLEVLAERFTKVSADEMNYKFQQIDRNLTDSIFLKKDGEIFLRVNTAQMNGPESFYWAAYRLGQFRGELPAGDYKCCSLTKKQRNWLENQVVDLMALNPELEKKHMDKLLKHYMDDNNKKGFNNIFNSYKLSCVDAKVLSLGVEKAEQLSTSEKEDFLRFALKYWVFNDDLIRIGYESSFSTDKKEQSFSTDEETQSKNQKPDRKPIHENIPQIITQEDCCDELETFFLDIKNYIRVQDSITLATAKKYTDDEIAKLNKDTTYNAAPQIDIDAILKFVPFISVEGGLGVLFENRESSMELSNQSLKYNSRTPFIGYNYGVEIGLLKHKQGSNRVFTFEIDGQKYSVLSESSITENLNGHDSVVGNILSSSSRDFQRTGLKINPQIKDKAEIIIAAYLGKDVSHTDKKFYSTVGQDHVGGNLVEAGLGVNAGKFNGLNFGLHADYKLMVDERLNIFFQNVGDNYNKNQTLDFKLTSQIPTGENSRFNLSLNYTKINGDELVNTGIPEPIAREMVGLSAVFSMGQKGIVNDRLGVGNGSFNAAGDDKGIYSSFNLITKDGKGYNVKLGLFYDVLSIERMGMQIFAEGNIGNLKYNDPVGNTTLFQNNTDGKVYFGIKFNFNK